MIRFMNMNTDLESKVVEIMSKYLKSSRGDIKTTLISVGFTGATKYLLEIKGKKLFLKVADSGSHRIDASLIEYESKIYDFLSQIGLTGTLFPKYDNIIDEDGIRILIIDYMNNVSWGGPWNLETIEKLDTALKLLHTKKISDVEFQKIEKISGEVLAVLGQELHPRKLSEEEISEKNKPFFDAWNIDRSGFIDSRGEVYFVGRGGLAEAIIEETLKDPGEKDMVLTMHDLNFANICFSDKQAFFVDPLFLRMGNANRDRTVVGVNILQQLGESVNQELRNAVIERYFSNKTVLASLIKYYVTTTAKKMDAGSESFQKFHQECAVVSLSLFENWDEGRRMILKLG
jgi:hypothetical protein